MSRLEYSIKPYTPVSQPDRFETSLRFPVGLVSASVGMSPTFVRKVVGRKDLLDADDVRLLLDQDAFGETFVPRSKVLRFLVQEASLTDDTCVFSEPKPGNMVLGDARRLIQTLAPDSINAVVTSTPYWAMRVYDTNVVTSWADGESCSFGLEQTPEGFIRHSVELLYRLLPALKESGSVWWNLMDSYNTRTQIRANAVEALRAMQGKDEKSWSDHPYRRYSAGHSYIQDGEQCLIPQRIAERASRIGYYVKSMISWCKSATTPEPQLSRVSRNVEYILHLTRHRTPEFHKEEYLRLPPQLGGRQQLESEKLSDFWYLPTSSGRDGHGAQFPIQLPARCIALSTSPGDVVLDPFIGSGTTGVAAAKLGRRCIGFDVSADYLATAEQRISQARGHDALF